MLRSLPLSTLIFQLRLKHALLKVTILNRGYKDDGLGSHVQRIKIDRTDFEQSVYSAGANIKENNFNPFAYSFSKKVSYKEDYAEGKRQFETTLTKAFGEKLTCVRFSIVLGEDDYTNRLKFHIEHIRNNKEIYFPNKTAKLSMLHSDDAAKALFHLGQQKPQEPMNVCSKEPIGHEKKSAI